MTSTARPRERPGHALAGWLVAPCTLLGIACAAVLVARGVDRAFVVAAAALGAVAIAWILVSTFWPASADRTCAACGEPGLVRLDPRTTRGVACSACGAADPAQSSFLLAEEEGVPIEPSIAYEKARRRGTTG